MINSPHYRTVQEWAVWYRQGGTAEVLRHRLGGQSTFYHRLGRTANTCRLLRHPISTGGAATSSRGGSGVGRDAAEGTSSRSGWPAGGHGATPAWLFPQPIVHSRRRVRGSTDAALVAAIVRRGDPYRCDGRLRLIEGQRCVGRAQRTRSPPRGATPELRAVSLGCRALGAGKPAHIKEFISRRD